MNSIVEQVRKNKINFFIFLLFILSLLLITGNVIDYGFWQFDSWAYTTNEMAEFKYNGRWLTPFLHSNLYFIPPLLAWFWAIISLYYYFHTFVKRFFDGLSVSIFLLLILPFLTIISPALMAQLNWPIHSLAALLILSIGAYFTKKNSNLKVLFIITIFTFAVLQSFAFMTIFLAIPSYLILSEMSKTEFIKKVFIIIFVWLISILIAYLLTKMIQYMYFGEFPPLPDWRITHRVNNANDLIINILHNIKLSLRHLNIYFSPYIGTVLVLFLFMISFSFYKKYYVSLRISIFLVIVSLGLLLSIYLTTAVAGTAIPFRATFLFGQSLLLLFIALYVLIINYRNSKVLNNILIIVFFIIIIKPFLIAYYNTMWYKDRSFDIKNTFQELALQSTRSIKKIIIDRKNTKDSNSWSLNYSDSLANQPLIMQPPRLKTAFTELGYNGPIVWCSKNTKNKECKETDTIVYEKCSYINPDVCTASDSNSTWFLKFR